MRLPRPAKAGLAMTRRGGNDKVNGRVRLLRLPAGSSLKPKKHPRVETRVVEIRQNLIPQWFSG